MASSLDSPLTSAVLHDSRAAWGRLMIGLAMGTFGSVGMWSVVVALPAVQAEFGVSRGGASLPYTLAMLGFGIGGIAMGRVTDRLGIGRALMIGIAALSAGYVLAGLSLSLWQFTLIHFLVGFGASATFGPMMAEVSHWFEKRRALAVSIAASGNYLAGAIWPPIFERGIAHFGWRATHIAVGLACLVGMSLLFLMLRRGNLGVRTHVTGVAARPKVDLRMSVRTLTILLSIAGVACCVAMSMPQVHLVAYCGDLGYGSARGAEMLALMLACGIISRVGSGFLADRIGGLSVLLIGSLGEAIALSFYLMFDGLVSLYVVSALFGLMQGGLVPSYAMIVRETMPPQEAAMRVGIVIFATVIGMSFGGWMSGVIFDLTGSYMMAFLHGIAWNVLNGAIALFLLTRARLQPALAV